MLCSEVQLVKYGDGFEDIKPLPCNRWSCDLCAPKRRQQLIAMAASGLPNKILTLTVNPAVGADPVDRRRLLHDAWKRLVKRIIRRYGFAKVHYMAFLERTKRGEPHLHILLRCGFVHQRWIAAQMADMIGAPVCWIERIANTRAAIRYVTKYVTKEPAQFGTSKRYWLSREWEVNAPPEREPATQREDRASVRLLRYAEWRENAVHRGLVIQPLSDGWHREWPRGTAWEKWSRDGPWADAAADALA